MYYSLEYNIFYYILYFNATGNLVSTVPMTFHNNIITANKRNLYEIAKLHLQSASFFSLNSTYYNTYVIILRRAIGVPLQRLALDVWQSADPLIIHYNFSFVIQRLKMESQIGDKF